MPRWRGHTGRLPMGQQTSAVSRGRTSGVWWPAVSLRLPRSLSCGQSIRAEGICLAYATLTHQPGEILPNLVWHSVLQFAARYVRWYIRLFWSNANPARATELSAAKRAGRRGWRNSGARADTSETSATWTEAPAETETIAETSAAASVIACGPFDLGQCIMKGRPASEGRSWTGSASPAASIAAWWSEPVPGREFHPLKSGAFSRRTLSPTTWVRALVSP